MNVQDLKSSPQRFLNRELSWLRFNRRVFEEAQNQRHPLFERLRFCAITARNMEEFFMVRVAGLTTQIRENINKPSVDGRTAAQQLELINAQSTTFMDEMQATWRALRKEMEDNNIHICDIEDLNKQDLKWAQKRFKTHILPVLTPTALDPAHPFPFIPNKGLATLIRLIRKTNSKEKGGHKKEKKKKDREEESLTVIIQIPETLERFVHLPDKDGQTRYMMIEKLIVSQIHQIFDESYKIDHYATFRILRDGEIEFEEEAEDLVLTFERAVKKRRRGSVIHLAVNHNIHEKALAYLIEQLKVSPKQVTQINGLIGLSAADTLITYDMPERIFPPHMPRFPERIREFDGDCFAAIRAKDIVVHHPYETFDVVVRFLSQAASDPQVVAIKQTLYRTSDNSPIVQALIEAAEAGKSVTAMVELKARFDEEANIKWARDMERAGVQVVYGFVDLKTHAKVSMVVREEDGTMRSYAHLGTGNYHPGNAQIYTDLSFFTCDPKICEDTAQMFHYMTGYAKPKKLNKISVSPLNVREKLNDLIDIEIKNAQTGKPAQIWAKCNALLDIRLIDKLYEASQAGVEITLVVRGICTLRPGIKGLSENIRVKSLIGRFLEHGRIYCFANGQALPSRKAKVFISSADLMARNLNRRIEAFVPIENETVHAQILDQIMLANLKDHRQSWEMHQDGTYQRISNDPNDFSAHEYFMENPSLSGRGAAIKSTPMPPRLQLDNLPDNQGDRE